MTKEEAIKVIRHMAYLSAHVVENGVEAYEYIEQFLSKPSLPSNLDKAAEKYAWMKEEPLSDGERLSFCFNPRIDAFKAGAKWMTEQGETIDGEVLPLGLWLRDYTNSKTSYPLGTKVVVQIRKKEA